MKRKRTTLKKRINKQTITATTTKNNQTLRMQKIMCITCSVVLRLNQFSMLIGKSSPVFSFSFFSPAMQSELPWLQRSVLKIPNINRACGLIKPQRRGNCFLSALCASLTRWSWTSWCSISSPPPPPPPCLFLVDGLLSTPETRDECCGSSRETHAPEVLRETNMATDQTENVWHVCS